MRRYSKGDFLISEPQLALHTSRLSARGRGLHSFTLELNLSNSRTPS